MWGAARPSESDLGGQISWAVDRRLGLADYQGLPAVARARSFIVSVIGQLDPVAIRDGYPMLEQPPIVMRPAPGMTRDSFLGSIAGELFDRSNAFLWLPATGRSATGRQDTALLLPFDEVHVTWDDSRLFRRYSWRGRDLIAGRDLLHIELPGRRPEELLTPSKFDVNADAFDRILAAELFAGDYFDNGGVPSVTLKFAGQLTDAEADAAKTRWVANHAVRSPGILPAGWDLHETGGNPDSAQLLETRRNGVLETARIFGIVPAELLVAELGGSSLIYQNVAGMLDTFMRVTGQPEYLAPIEEGLSDLLPRTQAVRFSLTELFRLSEPELIDTAVKALGAGIYTLPEVRRSLGRAPASNADPGIPPALMPTPPVPEEVPVNAV
jgi:hypothetical protein